MNPIRSLYDRLPADIRRTFRSILPGDLLRWYAHKRTDVYLISYPKCGRTWLRLMVGHAIASHYNLPLEEDILFLRWKTKPDPKLPMITVIHEDRPMLKTAEELEKSKARYQKNRVIFLARDPRDVIVSSYFEMSKRGHIFGVNPYEDRQPVFEGSLSEFIQRKRGGFDTIIAYYNIWAENRHIPEEFLLIRYEDIKENAALQLRHTLDFLDMQAVSDETIEEAVQYASFDNMRKMEQRGQFQSNILKPADSKDQNSYKTRRGMVKGYINYLNEDEIASLNRKIRENLSPIFGYNA
jgi:hypothetical protein